MKDWLKEILDPNGNQSTTRLLSIWLVVNAVLMGWYVLIFGTEHASEVAIVTGAITAIAGVWKNWQKSQEKKDN
jgi:uncharacterized membrane protein HdeD (DUF308 family)